LSKQFEWRDALVIVQPKTLLRWHQRRFKELWRRKSLLGEWRDCLSKLNRSIELYPYQYSADCIMTIDWWLH